MTISIGYNSSALGQFVRVDYDDVAHNLVFVSLGALQPGAPYFSAGDEVYTHTDATAGGTVWSIRASNSNPYAYVTSWAAPACSIVINSATPTNSTTPTSNDGSIVIVATGNGTKSYTIVNVGTGQSYSNSTGIFTNIPAGTYTATVYNVLSYSSCTDVETNIVVGYNGVTCDLLLGVVNQTVSPGGTITVVNYTTVNNEPVEYRLDAGAWQDSPVFTGLAAATYSLQIRFKNFTSCSNSRNITISAAPPCALVVSAIIATPETVKFGDNGALQIEATTGTGPLEYSNDNGGSYQSSKFFYNLAPGPYTVKVRDGAGCTITQVVTVAAYKIALLEFPIANGLRVIPISGPTVIAGALQNFDNTLFASMRFFGIESGCFTNKHLTSDVVKYQYRSSYTYNYVEVFTVAGVSQGSLTPVKKTGHMNKSDSRTALFSTAGANQTQIFFDTGLPGIYEIGQTITISGEATLNGTYEIADIRLGTGDAEGYSVLIIDKIYTSGTDPLTATIATTYDVEEFEVWEVTVDFNAYAAGQYYLKFTGTDPLFAAYVAQSEPVETSATLDGYVKIAWRNFENAFKVDYSTGIEHMIRVEGRVLMIAPGGESEVMEDSYYRQIKLRENVTRLMELIAVNVPPYLAEKMRIAFAHDYFTVDDVECQTDEKISFENVECDPFVDVTIQLRQVEFVAENSHDEGDVDSSILELGDGELMQVEP